MKLSVDLKRTYPRSPGGFAMDAHFECETETLAIVGPSGSGKTSVLDAIAGTQRMGRVVLDGVDISHVPIHQRQMAYVTQSSLLFPHMTVGANLLYSPRAQGVKEIAAALDVAHLWDRMPRNLSGGEQRRVVLARALASRPKIILLDEPFAGLDENRRRAAMALLLEIRQTFRIPLILVSHTPGEVVGLADQAVRMEAGHVASLGSSASAVRAGEAQIDNFLVGDVVAKDRVWVGARELAVVLPAGVSGRVKLACYAHDVLLAKEMPGLISARNCFPVTVAQTEDVGGAVLVSLAELPLRALITSEAAAALDVRKGAAMVAIVKSTSLVFVGGN